MQISDNVDNIYAFFKYLICVNLQLLNVSIDNETRDICYGKIRIFTFTTTKPKNRVCAANVFADFALAKFDKGMHVYC